MGKNDVEFNKKENITLSIEGENVVDNLETILRGFKKTQLGRPLDSHEEDLADEILRSIGRY